MRRMGRRIVLEDCRIGKMCVLFVTGLHIWRNINGRSI